MNFIVVIFTIYIVIPHLSIADRSYSHAVVVFICTILDARCCTDLCMQFAGEVFKLCTFMQETVHGYAYEYHGIGTARMHAQSYIKQGLVSLTKHM